MKPRVAWRNVVHYIRTDLREIAFPSSLPDPPSSKPMPRKLTIREHLQVSPNGVSASKFLGCNVWRTGTQLYFRSWRTGTIDDDEEKEDKPVQSKEKNPEEPSILEELALASRAGAESLRPALQRIYITRASVYRDALRSFVQGYQEGIGEAMSASKAMKNQVEREAYSEGGDSIHQPNVAPADERETKRELHQEKGMRS